jgi:hypothetical protein
MVATMGFAGHGVVGPYAVDLGWWHYILQVPLQTVPPLIRINSRQANKRRKLVQSLLTTVVQSGDEERQMMECPRQAKCERN